MYDSSDYHYLGKQSISDPIKIKYQDRFGKIQQPDGFTFATGGAGWCLSRPLYLLAMDFLSREDIGGFESFSSVTGLPDDMLIGFIISKLKVEMKNLKIFHSHLENLRKLNNLDSQVSTLSTG